MSNDLQALSDWYVKAPLPKEEKLMYLKKVRDGMLEHGIDITEDFDYMSDEQKAALDNIISTLPQAPQAPQAPQTPQAAGEHVDFVPSKAGMPSNPEKGTSSMAMPQAAGEHVDFVPSKAGMPSNPEKGTPPTAMPQEEGEHVDFVPSKAGMPSNPEKGTPPQMDMFNAAGVKLLGDTNYRPKAEDAPKPAKPAQGRQNLTFADMLNDLGLSGNEKGDSAALSKVQEWLAARPGYKPGSKTKAYLAQLAVPAEEKPAEEKPSEKKETAENQKSPHATNKGYKFKTRQLYTSAMQRYNNGRSTFTGNNGESLFFNRFNVNNFTVSDADLKNVLSPNVINAVYSRF